MVVAVARLLSGCGLDVIGVIDATEGGGEVGATSSGGPSVEGGAVDGDGGDLDADVVEAGAKEDVVATSAVSIELQTLDSTPKTVNLTSEGALDWVYWGYDGYLDSSLRKANVAHLITSPYVFSGSLTRGTSTSSWPITQTWTDGTAPAAGSSNWYTYYVQSDNVVITMEAAASTTPRTFVFFTSANDVNAQIEATLTDGTMDQSAVIVKGAFAYYRVAITYRAKTAGDTLQVRWRIAQRLTTASDAGIIITAAMLK